MKTKRFAVEGSRTERWGIYDTRTGNAAVRRRWLTKAEAQKIANGMNARIR